MSGFRSDDRHKLELHNFSVGSKIKAGNDEWLVVTQDGDYVALLNLQTWSVSPWYEVEDPNWITEGEARQIVSLTKLAYTFSDFEFDEKGLKK